MASNRCFINNLTAKQNSAHDFLKCTFFNERFSIFLMKIFCFFNERFSKLVLQRIQEHNLQNISKSKNLIKNRVCGFFSTLHHNILKSKIIEKCYGLCKSKNGENILMATSLILNGYTSITDAFRSSHYDRNAK